MVDALSSSPSLISDAWVPATWEVFLASCDRPEVENAQCYYDAGWMRIETMPTGSAHGQDNSILAAVITLYGTLRDLAYTALINTSFRQPGERECQPDLAYYIGTDAARPPKNNQPVDVTVWGAPTLAIEISSSTLSDDLGQKRLLYERLGVREYWVVNVEAAAIIAFEIVSGGSRQIQVSTVLPDLSLAIVEEALRRSQTEDHGAVNRWLLHQFQALKH
ncbi:Uma2 family endonuclease [Thermoleptolyngbya sp. PKUAC-SCTB121]|uniref:Uma2 family endonuclease n=1 Tax=Thermoleptolyngbya sp. PKUAC-SCTB121 TaxID=2811482 RepID=UPI0019622C61|nr:Uma2 family endonuclease [Thermoleptolyngbya sp. PKUAC-SCTB121]